MQVLLACLDPSAPPAFTNLALQILTSLAAALHLRLPPAVRLLPAITALLLRADVVGTSAGPAEPFQQQSQSQPGRQSHPQGVCEAVGGLRLLGRLAAFGHNDAVLRSYLPKLLPAVCI